MDVSGGVVLLPVVMTTYCYNVQCTICAAKVDRGSFVVLSVVQQSQQQRGH